MLSPVWRFCFAGYVRVVYPLLFLQAQQRMETFRNRGPCAKDNSVIYLLLSVRQAVGAAAIAQSELNRIWEHA
jgi:hypothetical protein